ncbi:MAG: hypothetical protein ACR2K6_03645 [Solirubrobacterales bacterium]
MGLFSRFRGPGRAGELQVGDPRFDEWEPVRDFEDIESARAWRRHLTDAGIEAAICSDYPLDRFGRGDIDLRVPPGSWSDAEEYLSNLDLD